MSYILDALKKAEQERLLAKVPSLATVHRPPTARGRRLWPWIAGVVIVVNAGVLIWLLRPVTVIRPESPAESSQASPGTSAQPAPVPPLDPVTRGSPAAMPPAPAAPLASPPSGHASDTAPPKLTRARPIESRPSSTVAQAPSAPKADSKMLRPADAPGPPAPPAPPVASNPVKPPGQATGSSSMSQAMPSAVQDAISKMHLQVVVYSEVPSDRLVFINNHKYVEGQSIDGKVVVETIKPDSAVLTYQGQRFSLRSEPATSR